MGNVNILEYYGADLVAIVTEDALGTTTPGHSADAHNASAFALLLSLIHI